MLHESKGLFAFGFDFRYGFGSLSNGPMRFVAILCLILIKNVAYIGGYAASHQPQPPQPQQPPFAPVRLAGQPESASALYSYDTHRLAKRMDLEACLGQFDVHKNTIIRTGESQAIGGKYLQGLELDTMEECQRLCCETETCDVYIFEDKNDGYCYLFECGTPENFHCKFTRHSNYTSAVLTSVRHVTESTTLRPLLPHIDSNNISQQEWELTSLKVKPEAREKAVENPTAAATGAMPQLAFPQKAVASPNSTTHCGRFQFTCHSGECIAVYNACDGIPQCEDGSDEGPECSGAASNTANSVSKPNVEPVNVNILESTLQKSPSITQYQSQSQQPEAQHSVQQQLTNLQQQQQPQPRLPSAMMPALINNREDPATWVSRKMVTDVQQADAANQAGYQSELNSRFFNHKGGLQLPHNNGMVVYPNGNAPNLSPMYAATLQRSGIYLPQGQNIPNGVYTPAQQQQILPAQAHIIVPPIVNWQQPQQHQQATQSVATPISPAVVQMPQPPNYVLNTPQQLQPQSLPANQPKPLPPAEPVNNGRQSSAAVQVPAAAAPVSAPVQTVQDKIAEDNKSIKKDTPKHTVDTDGEAEEYEDYEEKSTEPPKKKQRKHKKVKTKATPIETKEAPKTAPAPSPVHEQYKMIHESLAMEFRDHDGLSERPGGAVLSLTLGLLVTAALAILVGCRMRTVGRRARRLGGKTPYSHEADFLVNGMYL